MNGVAIAILGIAACVCGGLAAGLLVRLREERRLRSRRRVAALGEDVANARRMLAPGDSGSWSLRYCAGLTRRLFMGSTEPICPSVKGKRAGETRAGKRYVQEAAAAGCAKSITPSAFCEARVRLAIVGALAGAVFGALFSLPFAVLLGCAGAMMGCSMPLRAVRSARRERGLCAERHLSEMLEVVALGLRSGLTFDRSFALYGEHFDNAFAQSCAKACRCWAIGLMTREEALRDLAASYDCDQLERIVESVVRNLRFGSALTGSLEEAAAQSRAAYRTALEERVAKAPVKMMLPTGTLILPAMLLLVMGPVLLEMVGGF
ncbi:MAG TPA: type II secretion system protein [Eggerthellaceae bacterium]|nr:type II secretion system protein [Eggerthellaceae bacterium]